MADLAPDPANPCALTAESATTLIAAEQLGRRCFAVEIEPRYIDVAVQRWQTFAGGVARLALADGLPGPDYAEVAARRLADEAQVR